MSKQLTVHPLVDILASRPDGIPEDSVVVHGLVGRGESGEWRLYQNLELTTYLAFGEDDVLFSLELSNDFDPLAGTRIWLKADAQVKVRHVDSTVVPARFLSGRVTERYASLSGPLTGLRVGLLECSPGLSWIGCCKWDTTYTQDPKNSDCDDKHQSHQGWKTCNPGGNPNDPCNGSQAYFCTYSHPKCGDASDGSRCPK